MLIIIYLWNFFKIHSFIFENLEKYYKRDYVYSDDLFGEEEKNIFDNAWFHAVLLTVFGLAFSGFLDMLMINIIGFKIFGNEYWEMIGRD